MKKSLSCLFLTCVLLLSGCALQPKQGRGTEPSAIPAPTQTAAETAPSDDVIALLLYSYIDAAIRDYYGKPVQCALYDAAIDRIVLVDNLFSYEVTVTVPTFHGAHNAPYGAETMTFAVAPNDIQLLAYTHRDATP